MNGRLSGFAADGHGQGLVELLIAMAVLAASLTALLGLLLSASITVERAGGRGTAPPVAHTQPELHRR